jgi:hypothetical protein
MSNRDACFIELAKSILASVLLTISDLPLRRCHIDATLREYSRALMDPSTGIPTGKRRLRLTTYYNCFSGTDAAGWFMANMEGITTIEQAKVCHLCVVIAVDLAH